MMATSSLSQSAVGWLAIATGVVGLFAVAFITLFFTAGAPFGALNDISNDLLAILSLLSTPAGIQLQVA
jgi:hypothetical protein